MYKGLHLTLYKPKDVIEHPNETQVRWCGIWVLFLFNKLDMVKIEYYVGLKLVESHYKPNIAIAKSFVKQLKQSGNYKGDFKLINC